MIDGHVLPKRPFSGEVKLGKIKMRAKSFVADFNGPSPSPSQFYSWEGRVFSGTETDALENIRCENGIVHLTSTYDSNKNLWIGQMMSTGGLFESDDFVCTFRAKFQNIPGAWANVITYGTGTHWTNGVYSDGVKWPAGGEIDAFEQAGGYSVNPKNFRLAAHYGSGTNSGYPKPHEANVSNSFSVALDEWHDFKFSLKNGIVSVYVDKLLVETSDFSNLEVNNNYLFGYKPFLKPQAFYISGGCAADNSQIDTTNSYDFQVSDFVVTQDEQVECRSLEIHPQMWGKNTNLVFPVNAEFYLDREYYPTNTSNKACVWTISDPSVATVCQGYVKTLKAGNAVITATCGNASATYSLSVSNTATVPCAGITVNEIGTISSETNLVYYLYPRFTTDTVSISSSNTDVVDTSGSTLIPIANGTANVTVSCGNKSETVSVSVTGMLPYITPFIEYDFETGAEDFMTAFNAWDGTSQNIPLTSLGENQTSGGYLELTPHPSGPVRVQLKCQTENVLVSATENFMFVMASCVDFITYTYNGGLIHTYGSTNHNNMPTFRNSNGSLAAYWGSANGFTFENTPEYAVIGHDTSGYYLYYNGAVQMTGGSGSNAGYLSNVFGIFSNIFASPSNATDAQRAYNLLKTMKIGVFKGDRTVCHKAIAYFSAEVTNNES